MILFRVFFVLIAVTLCFSLYTYIHWRNHPITVEGLTDPPATYTEPGVEGEIRYNVLVNSSNIAFLKSKVDTFAGLKEQVDKLQIQTDGNSKAIKGLGQKSSANANNATNNDLSGKSTPPASSPTGKSTPPGSTTTPADSTSTPPPASTNTSMPPPASTSTPPPTSTSTPPPTSTSTMPPTSTSTMPPPASTSPKKSNSSNSNSLFDDF